MFGPGIFYVLATLGLIAVAIVAHIKSTSLSLPTTPSLTLLPILLPLLGALNALFRPYLLQLASHRSAPGLQRLLPNTFQTFQAIFTTFLATLFLQTASGGPLAACRLGTRWQALFAAKDGAAVQRIQDALNCCGFNSVRDRAWPFPPPGTGAATCAESFHRTKACAGPWGAALGQLAGADLGVVLAVGLLQVITIFLSRSSGSWRQAWWAQSWSDFFGGGVTEQQRQQQQQRRPLLQGREIEEEEDHDEEIEGLLPRNSHGIAYGTGAAIGSRAAAHHDDEAGWARHGEDD